MILWYLFWLYVFVFMFLYMCICLHIYFECVFFVCNFEYFCIHNLNCLACICILIILQVMCICILHFNEIILCFICFLNSYVDVFNITKVLCFCYFISIVFFFHSLWGGASRAGPPIKSIDTSSVKALVGIVLYLSCVFVYVFHLYSNLCVCILEFNVCVYFNLYVFVSCMWM